MLEWCDAVLAKVKFNILYDAWMALRNAFVFGALQLFLLDLISKATNKSSHTLHDEAIQGLQPRLPSGSVRTVISHPSCFW